MPKTIRELLKLGETKLVGLSNTPKLDSELLLSFVKGVDRLSLLMHPNVQIDNQMQKLYENLLERRANYEPLAYIINQKEFWGIEFYVDENVLIPRPDTETLIEAVLRYFPDKKIKYQMLDLGSGSGALGISLLSEYRLAKCDFVDIQSNALAVAIKNAVNLNVGERAFFLKSDWFKSCPIKQYDIIVCNPPYIAMNEEVASETKLYEPHSALYATDDGMSDYQKIAASLGIYLSEMGAAFFEIGKGREKKVYEIFDNRSLEISNVLSDLNGIARCVVVRKKKSGNI